MRKLLVVFGLSVINYACAATSLQCSNNWYITGYYTPIEADFLSRVRHVVPVKDVGQVSMNTAFIRQVRIEGWGRTRFGWYLGYYSGAWHKSDAPLDARGAPLVAGTIATDPKFIASGKPVTIPGMYEHMNRTRFTAKDVGRNIRQRRIDVYTGEGHAAKQMAYRLTKRDHRVCM